MAQTFQLIYFKNGHPLIKLQLHLLYNYSIFLLNQDQIGQDACHGHFEEIPFNFNLQESIIRINLVINEAQKIYFY